MAESIRAFENSLRDYLMDVQADSYNTFNRIEHKYNNLKVYMDPEKISIPHFWVSMNISAVCYKLDTLEKIDGGIGADERFVTMWAGRPNINGGLKKHWVFITNSKEIYNQQIRKKIEPITTTPKEEITDVSESITGTGVMYKLKAFESKLKGRK